MARKTAKAGSAASARPARPALPALEAGDFGTVIRRSNIILCCGTGGVGKTTTAAALALAGAQDGRRCVVVTIDPAKRLADALGLDGLTNHPVKVDLPDVPGEVWALMLDTKATFDDLVRRHAPSAEQAERILVNAFYKNISGALGGTQEYMATEKLYELVNEPVDGKGLGIPRFDLIVVATPPPRNALDFISAPTRLTRLLDNRVFRALMAPARSGLRVFGAASQLVLRGIGKVIGGDVLADAVAFFQSFEGMEAGFRERAQAVLAVLKEPSTAWILITTPRQEAVDEAMFFGTELRNHDLQVAGLVANRMYPDFGPLPDLAGAPEAETPALQRARRGATLSAAHRGALDPLRAVVGTAPWAVVPLADHDLHDLGELLNFARDLMRT
jgi:anion-transporting  ArsA/GET3 family ATPase